MFSKEYRLIENPEKKFPIIYKINDDRWESNYVAKTYQLVEERYTNYYFAHQEILLVKDAIVADDSDIVITDNGIIWDKAYQTNFSKIVPLDKNLYTHTADTAKIFRYSSTKRIQGRVISMLGVHAKIWAHYIVQFLPKLYYAEDAGLLDENITILIPEYRDMQLKNTTLSFGEKHTKVKFEVATPKCEYICDELYYIPSSVYMGNHGNYVITSDFVIPDKVKHLLRERLVSPYIEKIKDNKAQYEKLYLVRRETYRKLVNWPEVEDWFKNKGFHLVEPHKLTLEEKADLFYHAKIVVGPYSAAWTNTMFCNGAKALMFTNLARAIESYQVAFCKIGNVDVLQVTGYDVNSNIHTDYKVPLSRIEAAYNELING
jgi:capsular polysaccharide biosynthesis protein